MPKGQTQKMYGSIVHVPVNISSTRMLLSRQVNCSEVILVKLNKSYHIKAMILSATSATQSKGRFRISSNSEPSYHDVVVDIFNVNQDLLFTGILTDFDVDFELDGNDELVENTPNPVNVYRQANDEYLVENKHLSALALQGKTKRKTFCLMINVNNWLFSNYFLGTFCEITKKIF